MSEFDQPISAEMVAELAAIDRLISGQPDGSESPELVQLTELLSVTRPKPRPEFAAALDAKAEARFGLREPAKRRQPDWRRRWTWFRNGAVAVAIGASFAAILVIANSPNQSEALSSVASTISAPAWSGGSSTSGSASSGASAGGSQDSKSSTGSEKTSAGFSTFNGSTGSTDTTATPATGTHATATDSTATTDANGALTLKVAPSRVNQTLTDIVRTVKAHGGQVVTRRRSNSPLAYRLQVNVAADRLSSLVSALASVAGVKVLARHLPTRPAHGSQTVQLVIVVRTA